MIEPGATAPDFTLRDQDGEEVALVRLRRPQGPAGLLSGRLQPRLHRPALHLPGGARRDRGRGATSSSAISVDRVLGHKAFREQLGLDDAAARRLPSQGRGVAAAYGAYLPDWGTANRSLVLVGEDGVVRWSHAVADAARDPRRQPDLRRRSKPRPERRDRAHQRRRPASRPDDHVRGEGPRRSSTSTSAARTARRPGGRSRRCRCASLSATSRGQQAPAGAGAARRGRGRRRARAGFFEMVDSLFADRGRDGRPAPLGARRASRPRPRALRARAALRGRSPSGCGATSRAACGPASPATPAAFARGATDSRSSDLRIGG